MFETEVIKELFLRRISSYGIEKVNGTFSGTLYFVDDGMLDMHIDGKQNGKPFSMGIAVSDKTSWGFVHLYLASSTQRDTFEILEQYRHVFKEQIRLIQQQFFNSYEIRLYSEYNGSCGYRLWCFFEAYVNSTQLFRLFSEGLKEVEWLCADIKCDLVPGQVKDGYVALPLGINLATGNRRLFVGEDLNPYHDGTNFYPAQIKHLRAVVKTPVLVFEDNYLS